MILRRLAIVILFASVLPVHGQEHTNHPGSNQGESNHVANPPLPPRHALCTIKQDATTIECQWAESEFQGYLKRLLVPENAPNIALVIVGICGIGAAVFTLRAIRKQAEAQMNADRAWIFASIAAHPKEPMAENLISSRIVPGIFWLIEIRGDTPAKIIRKDIRCRIVDPTPTNVSQPTLEPVPVYLPNNAPNSQVVSPPGWKGIYPVEVEIEPNAVLSDRLTHVGAGFAFLVSYGRVEYEDAFQRKGVTQFCAIYHPPGGGEIRSPDGTLLNPTGFRIGGPDGYNYNK